MLYKAYHMEVTLEPKWSWVISKSQKYRHSHDFWPVLLPTPLTYQSLDLWNFICCQKKKEKICIISNSAIKKVLKIQYLFIYILLFYGCTVNYFLFFGVSLANDTRWMVLNKKQQWCTWILLFKWKKTFAWDCARAVYTIRQIVNMETVCGNEISPSANTCLFFLNRLSSCSNFILVWHAFIIFSR